MSKGLRRLWHLRFNAGILYCSLCGELIEKDDPKGPVTADHIIPLSKGGSNRVENKQPAHRKCNEKKGDNVESEDFYKGWRR